MAPRQGDALGTTAGLRIRSAVQVELGPFAPVSGVPIAGFTGCRASSLIHPVHLSSLPATNIARYSSLLSEVS